MFTELTEGCLPTKGSKYAACVDVYSAEDINIPVGETKLIKLGISLDSSVINNLMTTFMSTHFVQLMLRSSLAKKGLIMPSGVGVIDLDYTGEIMMPIHNPTVVTGRYESLVSGRRRLCGYQADGCEFAIIKGQRIGQVTLLEHKAHLFNIGTNVIRAGGFGSTGE